MGKVVRQEKENNPIRVNLSIGCMKPAESRMKPFSMENSGFMQFLR